MYSKIDAYVFNTFETWHTRKKNIVQIVKKFTIKFKILLFSSITGQIKPLAIV